MMKKIYRWRVEQKGFGLVETIVAMAIFIILAATGAGFTLPALRMNRLGGNVTDATLFAQEGIEAARSIKLQGWDSPFLATDCSGGCGVSASGGFWVWNGINNQKTPYTRVITVSSVFRDGSGGIVLSGGTDDPNTKKVTVTVSWNFIAARPESVTLTTYLTNWIAVITSSPTPTTTITPTITPTPATCNDYAVSSGYTSGTCRANPNQCTQNGETHLSGGDVYCTGGGQDTCCAAGTGSTPTPTLSPTPTTTTTPTPTLSPTPTPANCSAHCVQLYGTTGACLKAKDCTAPMKNEGKIYECTSPNICCCN